MGHRLTPTRRASPLKARARPAFGMGVRASAQRVREAGVDRDGADLVGRRRGRPVPHLPGGETACRPPTFAMSPALDMHLLLRGRDALERAATDLTLSAVLTPTARSPVTLSSSATRSRPKLRCSSRLANATSVGSESRSEPTDAPPRTAPSRADSLSAFSASSGNRGIANSCAQRPAQVQRPRRCRRRPWRPPARPPGGDPRHPPVPHAATRGTRPRPCSTSAPDARAAAIALRWARSLASSDNGPEEQCWGYSGRHFAADDPAARSEETSRSLRGEQCSQLAPLRQPHVLPRVQVAPSGPLA